MPIVIAGDLANFPEIQGKGLELATKLARDGYAKGGVNGKAYAVTLERLELIQDHRDRAVELQTQAIRELPNQAPDATRLRLRQSEMKELAAHCGSPRTMRLTRSGQILSLAASLITVAADIPPEVRQMVGIHQSNIWSQWISRHRSEL